MAMILDHFGEGNWMYVRLTKSTAVFIFLTGQLQKVILLYWSVLGEQSLCQTWFMAFMWEPKPLWLVQRTEVKSVIPSPKTRAISRDIRSCAFSASPTIPNEGLCVPFPLRSSPFHDLVRFWVSAPNLLRSACSPRPRPAVLGTISPPLYQAEKQARRQRWSLSRSPQMPSAAAAAAALLLQYVAALLRLFPLLPAPLQLRFGAEPWLCSSLAGLDAWQPSGQLCSLLFVWKAAAAAAKGVGAWGARGLIDSDVHQWVLSFDPALDSGREVVLGL